MSIDENNFAGIIDFNYDQIGAFHTQPVEPAREQLVELFTEMLAELAALESEEDWEFLHTIFERTLAAVAPVPLGSSLLVANPSLVITQEGPLPIDPGDKIVGTFLTFTPDKHIVCSEMDPDQEIVFTATGDAALYAVLTDAYVEVAADGTMIPLGETQVSLSNGAPELHHVYFRP